VRWEEQAPDQGVVTASRVAALALVLCGDDAEQIPAPISRSDGVDAE